MGGREGGRDRRGRRKEKGGGGVAEEGGVSNNLKELTFGYGQQFGSSERQRYCTAI